MVELTLSDDDPSTFLLPLPPGAPEHDARLFGLWTYEFRFGHKDPWSLAHARDSRPLRVTGVQHPAPELPCVAAWRRLDLYVPGPLPVPVPMPTAGGVKTVVATDWAIVATVR